MEQINQTIQIGHRTIIIIVEFLSIYDASKIGLVTQYRDCVRSYHRRSSWFEWIIYWLERNNWLNETPTPGAIEQS